MFVITVDLNEEMLNTGEAEDETIHMERLLDWHWSVPADELPPEEVNNTHNREDGTKTDGNRDSSILTHFRSLLVIDTHLTRNDSQQSADHERRKQLAGHFVVVVRYSRPAFLPTAF